MSQVKKRTRSDSIDGDTSYQPAMTMADHLQGCTASLTSTLDNLKVAVNILDKVTPSMRLFSYMSEVNRNCEIMTVDDIKQARDHVDSEVGAEINWCLNEAQTIFDQMALEAELVTKKQQNNQSSSSPPTQQDQDALEMIELDKRWQACQAKLQALDVEKEELDDTLAALELEVAQLDRELEKRQEIEQKEQTLAMQQSVEKDEAMVDPLVEEEAQLIKELEAIREQQQQQQKVREQQQAQHNQQQQQQQQRQIIEKEKVVMEQVPLTKATISEETFKQQISLMKDCIEHLRTLSPDVAPVVNDIDTDILRSYLAALEQEQGKMIDLKAKLNNNRTILKQYCKHVLPNKTTGFVAQKLVDLVFTDQGFRVMTLPEIVEEFDSARHKDIVKQLVERYPGFNRQ